MSKEFGADEFWSSKPLEALSDEEWEALCDGCGRCCLRKLEDVDSGHVHFTDVACRLLDAERCRCRNYAERTALVADCVRLARDRLEDLDWMPTTCAYRLRRDGEPLPDWHPLVSGDPNSVHRAGISVRGRVVSEQYVHADELEARLVSWVRSRR